MKLFTKLFLQVFVGIFLMSQCMFLYFLYTSARQNIMDAKAYEWMEFRQRFSEFCEDCENSLQVIQEGEFKNIIISERFRNAFGSTGALYQETKEIVNLTPYEFELPSILAEKDWNHLPLLTRINGRYLLVSADHMAVYLPQKSADYIVVKYKDITGIFERSRTLFFRGLFFTAAMILILGILLYQGLRRTLKPLMELKTAAAGIAEGVYTLRVSVKGRDEIAELGNSFNKMAEKIEEHVEKLSEINDSQRQLLGSLAHELKTPMTAMIGYADTLLTVRLSEKRREQALHYIENECRRLSRLAVKMLELTGLYESAEEIRQTDEKILDFLYRLKDLTAYRLKEKRIELEISCEPRELRRRMDGDLMMSLFMNLVDNAFKASEPGGKIKISANEKEIAVEDFGRGIPKGEVERITEAFYMVDKARSKSEGGIGLGLALCQKIADIHGAELVIESEEGKGTRVSVRWQAS